MKWIKFGKSFVNLELIRTITPSEVEENFGHPFGIALQFSDGRAGIVVMVFKTESERDAELEKITESLISAHE